MVSFESVKTLELFDLDTISMTFGFLIFCQYSKTLLVWPKFKEKNTKIHWNSVFKKLKTNETPKTDILSSVGNISSLFELYLAVLWEFKIFEKFPMLF